MIDSLLYTVSTCLFEGAKPLIKRKLIPSKICWTNVSCTTFNDTLRRNEAWWMAAGGSRLVAVPDGGQSVTAPRQATRCPLLPAGDTGMCNVSSIINHFSSDTLELLGLFLISCVVQQIFNNFPSIVVDHITAFSHQNGGFWF